MDQEDVNYILILNWKVNFVPVKKLVSIKKN